MNAAPPSAGAFATPGYRDGAPGFVIRELVPEDATRIGAMEARVYGAENAALICGPDHVRAELGGAISADENFSFGAFDPTGDELLGYVICYLDRSRVHDDAVAYVSDLAVSPGPCVRNARMVQARLGDRLVTSTLRRTRRHGLFVEAECRLGCHRLVKRHPEYLFGLGYACAAERPLPAYHGGEDFVWLRLEPRCAR